MVTKNNMDIDLIRKALESGLDMANAVIHMGDAVGFADQQAIDSKRIIEQALASLPAEQSIEITILKSAKRRCDVVCSKCGESRCWDQSIACILDEIEEDMTHGCDPTAILYS